MILDVFRFPGEFVTVLHPTAGIRNQRILVLISQGYAPLSPSAYCPLCYGHGRARFEIPESNKQASVGPLSLNYSSPLAVMFFPGLAANSCISLWLIHASVITVAVHEGSHRRCNRLSIVCIETCRRQFTRKRELS